jgi:hypothetical protein
LLERLDETLLPKLDLSESLKLLWTLPGGVGWRVAPPTWTVEAEEADREGQLRRDRDLELEGRSREEEEGAWTSTLNLAVAVTLVTWLPGVGVEQGEEPPLPLG